MKITYQGFTCSDVQFVRSRGITPDSFWVTIPVVRDFPEGFKPLAPKAGEPLILPPGTTTTTDNAQPEILKWVGPLVLELDGFETIRVEHVFVRQVVEVLREAEDIPRAERVSSLKLILSDLRMLWSLGVVRDSEADGWVPRWSFNRLDASGDYSRDSVDKDGKPFTLRAMLERFVVGALPSKPKLLHVPANREDFERPADLQYEPFEPAAVALMRAVDEHKTSDPVFSLSGAVGLYDDGEGQVAFAQGDAIENTGQIPAQFKHMRRLKGTSHQAELGYPPQYAAVAGGQTIATAAVDRWEFVLNVGGSYVPLTDANVKRITKDERYGLDWLSRWIVAKPEHQKAVVIPDRVARLLKQQAWKLVRLPQVEIEQDVPAVPFGPQPEGEPAAGASPSTQARAPGEIPVEGLFQDLAFIRPGPYAHLLPLLPQGKSQGGRRVPVEVETYAHGPQHFAWRTSPEHQEWTAARRAVEVAKQGIANALYGDSPLRKLPPVSILDQWAERAGGSQQLSAGRAGIEDVWTIVAQEPGVTPEAIEAELHHARRLEVLRDDRPELAAIYETAITAEFRARDKVALVEPGRIPAPSLKIWEIAKSILAFEKQLKEQQGYLTGDGDADGTLRAVTQLARDPRNRVLREDLSNKVGDLVRDIANDRLDKEALVNAGGGADARGQRILAVVNEGRTTDTGARVVDAALGVVKLSRLPGWIEDPVIDRAELGPVRNVAAGDMGRTRFVPGPVRVTFGHTLRPRKDAAYGAEDASRPLGRPITGVDTGLQFEAKPDVVRSARNDAETWFVHYLRRQPGGAASAVAPKLIEDPLVIRRRDLVELIDVDGNSNRAKLEEVAAKAARQRFQSRELVEGMSVELIGLWPVNCDGVVARVTITTAKGSAGAPAGFMTTVTTGTRKTLDALPGTTRVRPRPVVSPDAAKREGTSA